MEKDSQLSNYQNRFFRKRSLEWKCFSPPLLFFHIQSLRFRATVSTQQGIILLYSTCKLIFHRLQEDLIIRFCGGFITGAPCPTETERNLERRGEPVANASQATRRVHIWCHVHGISNWRTVLDAKPLLMFWHRLLRDYLRIFLSGQLAGFHSSIPSCSSAFTLKIYFVCFQKLEF